MRKSGCETESGRYKTIDKYVITAACVECAVCENRCPSGAITEGSNKYVITSHCTGCGICINVCPVNAIVKK